MAKQNNITAFFGRQTFFEGNLTFEGTLQIDGRYKGTISASGTLIVGKTGKVESDIRVSSVIICGEVHGSVFAEQSIEIRVPGKMFGDIQAPTVIIQEGVAFEGNCRTQPITDPQPAKAAPVHAAEAEAKIRPELAGAG